MTQCEKCKEHGSKENLLCTHVVTLQELSGRNNKNAERNNGAGNDSLERFAVANQDKRSDKAYQPVKHHFRKAQNNQYAGCATR